MSGLVHVVDDDEAVAQSTAALLKANDFECRVFNSGEQFLTALPALPSACVLLDLRMPGVSGMDVMDELASRQSTFPVIVLTGHGNVEAAVQAMKLGAVDFLEKPCSEEALLNALQSGLQTLEDPHRNVASDDPELEARLARLTRREREVLDHLVRGKVNKVIAHDLGISQRTVEIHRARIKSKLDARSLADLITMVRPVG